MPNYRTPPTPIKRHLSRQHTNTVAAHAVIEQAFFPELGGWCDVSHLPFPTFSAIRTLQARGATSITVGYCKPLTGGRRVRADFTVAECLS
jgi:hypothetical protein